MIYEVRTYRLKVGGQAEFVERFGEAYERRRQHSEMAAFLITTVGPLNEIIHVWPYESFEHRAQVRADAVKAGAWPPKAGHTSSTRRPRFSCRLPSRRSGTWTPRDRSTNGAAIA